LLQLVDILNTAEMLNVVSDQLKFIIETFTLDKKLRKKIDSLFVNIQCAPAWSL